MDFSCNNNKNKQEWPFVTKNGFHLSIHTKDHIATAGPLYYLNEAAGCKMLVITLGDWPP
jgi:hypothetical protein